MKIAFLNIYQNRMDRGSETFVKEVARRLKKNHEVVLIGGNKLPLKRWPVLWRAFIDPHGLQNLFWSAGQLPKIWREKFDVVIPLNGGWQPALIRLVTWLYGGKMVIPGQSGMGWDDRNNLWTFPNAFVALSTQAKQWAQKASPFVNCIYIPNGVDTHKFGKDGEIYETKLKSPIVLCVGALIPSKRIELVVEAVAKLGNVSLLVVGDGDGRDKIAFLGKKLLGDRFELTKLPHSEMPKVYRLADVFTLPSMSYYAFEIVFVEAMASGLPVVANRDPIRKEIVGEAGILVDPTDIDKYSKSIDKALNTKWGGKPTEQASKFDWDIIASKYEILFKDLAGRK